VPTAEEGTSCQRGGVGGFEDEVSGRVDKRRLAARIVTPEHKDDSFFAAADGADDGVREPLPSETTVGCGFTGADCEHGVEQKDALTCPRLKIRFPAHCDPEVAFDFFENVLEGRRGGNVVRHGEGQPHCLAVSVVWVLPENDHLDLVEGAELECLEDQRPRRKNDLPRGFFRMQGLGKLDEILFLEFFEKDRFPGFLYSDYHLPKVTNLFVIFADCMALFKNFKNIRLSMRVKLILSLGSIAVVLLISSIISVMQYDRMSNYVSTIIGEDIQSIEVAQNLLDISTRYNLDILAVIGDENKSELPEFDEKYFIEHCDSLKLNMGIDQLKALTDSVEYSFSAYMLTSLELKDVLQSDFINTRDWFFNRLQPRYARLDSDIDVLIDAIYKDLAKNSLTFDRGFYRSIIPGIVAVGVGLLLILMLFFFLLIDYVNPVNRMLDSLEGYRVFGKKYFCRFEGDAQLSELNDGIQEIANENIKLRKRLLEK